MENTSAYQGRDETSQEIPGDDGDVILTCCPHCSLLAVKCGFCHFCEEKPEESNASDKLGDDRKEDVDPNNTTQTKQHTDNQQTQHTQQLSSSCAVSSHDPPDCHHASSQHQSGLDCEVGRGRRTCTSIMDSDADQGQVGRTQGREAGCGQRRDGGQDVRIETCIQEEAGFGKLPEQGRDSFLDQCNHPSNVQSGGEGNLRGLRASGHREGELRQVCRHELPTGGISTSQLPGLGNSDSSRVRQSALEAVPTCSLGCQKHQESAEQPHVTKGYQKHVTPPKSESDGSYTVVSEPNRHSLDEQIEDHLTKFMAKKDLEMNKKDQELEQLRRQLKEVEDAKNALELQQARNKTRKET